MYMSKITAIAAAALLMTGCEKATMQSGPGQPGATQTVRLVWKAGLNQWKVQLNGGQEQDPKTAKTLLAQGAGPTMFVVEIAGNPNASFKDPGGLSVWEGAGAKGSPQQGINSNQILGPIVTKNGKLVFFDLNQGNPVTLNYALHFENGIPSVDPIIENNP